jgi:tetratricopeptide (TPR) repeat protein
MPGNGTPQSEPKHLAEGESPCRLAGLVSRSQLDFEIDFFERILNRDPNYVEVLVNLGELFSRKGCHKRALQVDLRLADLIPHEPTVYSNLACSFAALNHPAEALQALRRAVDLGYDDLEHLLIDADLGSLHALAGFQELVRELDRSRSIVSREA